MFIDRVGFGKYKFFKVNNSVRRGFGNSVFFRCKKCYFGRCSLVFVDGRIGIRWKYG